MQALFSVLMAVVLLLVVFALALVCQCLCGIAREIRGDVRTPGVRAPGGRVTITKGRYR